MHTLHAAVLATMFLMACESAPEISATSGSAKASSHGAASATAAPPTATSSASPPAPSPSATPPAPVTASASSSNAPCPEGSRKEEKLRYCITLPPNPLALTYEGDDPKQGIREELEVSGNRIIIEVGPMLPGATVASLKESALKVNASSIVESGDLKGGFWMQLKDGGHTSLVSRVISGNYQVICTFQVADEKHLEMARSVVKSLMAF